MKLRITLPRFRGVCSGDPKIAVMGPLRSGTNLVARLLEKHWRVATDFNCYGWKHAGVPILGPSSGLAYPNTPIVWVCKCPYSLTVSLHRYRFGSTSGRGLSLEGAPDFSDFLRSPITIWDSQLSNSPSLRFANPVQYWNFITWNFESLDPARFNTIGFNYEDILADPQVLNRVENLVPIKRREVGPIELPKKQMGRGIRQAKDGVGEFDAAAYLSKSYLASYTPDDLAFIATQVDPWLMQRRGYGLP